MWARLGCGGTQSLQYTDELVYMFPQAPVGAVRWARCQPGQLSASVGSSVGAAGSVRVVVILRNSSQAACWLFGYARLGLVGTKGQELPSGASRGKTMTFPEVPPHPVGLVPRETASFDIDYGDYPAGEPLPPYAKACPSASKLKVFLPGNAKALVVPVEFFSPCGGGDARQLLRTGKRRHTALLKRTNDRSTALAGRSYQSRENLHSLAFFKPERRVF